MMVLTFSLVDGWSRLSCAQSEVGEYQIKAAFLYHFLQFIEWPAETQPDSTGPYVIGVLGHSRLGSDFEGTLKKKFINSHPVRVEYVSTDLPALKKCHIVFIPTSEGEKGASVIASLKGTSVLTVGESPGFIEAGGMINFIVKGQKVRFAINQRAARSAGLGISSRLLQLAISANTGASETPALTLGVLWP